MGRATKIWLVIGTSLFVVGLIVFGAVMSILRWDFTSLSTVKYETNEYEINEGFQSIAIKTDTADVAFVPSEGEKVLVVCRESQNERHSVAVKDGSLVIDYVDTRKWYDYIGIGFTSAKITVYIPTGEYEKLFIGSSTGDVHLPKEFTFHEIDISESTGHVTVNASTSGLLKIKTATGDIRVENISVGKLDLSVSTGRIHLKSVVCAGDASLKVDTGDVRLEGVTCQNLVSNGSTGKLLLRDTVAEEKFSLQRSTGDIRLDACDAAEIFMKTGTGDIKGTLLSDKVFLPHTGTGSINVPKTTDGGKCEITTSTGDIQIEIK